MKWKKKILLNYLKKNLFALIGMRKKRNGILTGAGRIDIYLRFLNGLKTVVELKMCGNGYSGGYALDGLEQLTHYLENKQTHLGYLLIFDARKRELGKGINSQYLRGNYTIRSYIADVRPTVKVKD